MKLKSGIRIGLVAEEGEILNRKQRIKSLCLPRLEGKVCGQAKLWESQFFLFLPQFPGKINKKMQKKKFPFSKPFLTTPQYNILEESKYLIRLLLKG